MEVLQQQPHQQQKILTLMMQMVCTDFHEFSSLDDTKDEVNIFFSQFDFLTAYPQNSQSPGTGDGKSIDSEPANNFSSTNSEEVRKFPVLNSNESITANQ